MPNEMSLPVNGSPLLDFDFVVNDNVALNATWSRFETPIVQYTTIDSEDYGKRIFLF